MRSLQVLRRALFGVAISAFVLASVPLATAAVYSPQQALPADTIQQFLANPAALLSQFPNGGQQLIKKVRDLAASDPATVDALLALLKNANPDQASAIGTGLGEVALMALNTDQAFAIQIQTEVAEAGNTSALVAFSAEVGGDVKIAASAAGVGGGGESQTTTTSGLGGFFAGGTFSLPRATNTADVFAPPTFFGSGTPGTQSYSPF